MPTETLEARIERIYREQIATDDGTVPIDAIVWSMLYGDDRIELCKRSGAFSYKSTQKRLRVACELLKQMIRSIGAV